MFVPGPLYHNAPFSYSTRGLVYGNHLVDDGPLRCRGDARRRGASPSGLDAAGADDDATHLAPAEGRLDLDMSSLQIVWHMASPCPPWLKEAWIEWLGGEKIFELYAGTEAQSVTVIRGDEWMTRRGSVGMPIYGEMKVVDADGNDVAAGEVGEIYMRPPDRAGHLPVRRCRRQATDDGWESLGDMGWIDSDGYVFLTDRLGDMILSGGANIYPAEVEAAIDEHPQVLSSAVVGLADEDLGNRIHAIVQPVPGATVSDDELRVPPRGSTRAVQDPAHVRVRHRAAARRCRQAPSQPTARRSRRLDLAGCHIDGNCQDLIPDATVAFHGPSTK